jgi:adenylate cyclase
MNKVIQYYAKENGRLIIASIVIWCIAKQLFMAIKLWGIENTAFQTIHLHAWQLFFMSSITGILDGFIFGVLDVWFDKHFRKMPLLYSILMKTLMNLFVALSLTILLMPILAGMTPSNGIPALTELLLTSNLIIVALYMLFMTTLVQLAKQVNSWVDVNDVLELMSNRDSIEENRIFLFLDMKSSTVHAETLGAQRYSALVQDCFQDISVAVKETGAEVYQYIGDEAVLTWPVSENNFQNAVMFHFRFRESLRFRTDNYQRRYGFVPEFKSGIHYGKVIKAQVGVVKKEIAFHGDVVNTASRIQGKCNELMRDLLVSESVRDQLPRNFRCDWEGTHQLKGKELDLNLYSIQKLTFETKATAEAVA